MPVGATHIPVTGIQCDICHTNTNIGGFLTRNMNHTVVAGTACAVCHGGAYLAENALTRVSNHIPDTVITGITGCNACHTNTAGTTSASWTTGEKMNHGAITTNCVLCHRSGVTYLGKMLKVTPGSHEGSKAADDCSKSGCHRPLGSIGSTFKAWN